LIVSILLIGLTFGIIATLAITRSIVKPMDKLLDATHRIANGDLTSKVNIQSNDEFETLGNAFDRMTDNLQKTTVSLDYVEDILQSMTDALLVLSPQGRIQRANTMACRLFEDHKDRLIGQYIGSFIKTLSDPDSVTWQQINQSGFTKNVETTCLSKENRKIPVLLSLSVMHDNNDAQLGFVCVIKDITELTETKSKLEETHKQMVDTSYLAGKSEVASNVLHNVKNVLNGLNISATLITESITNSQLINLKKTMELVNAHSENLENFLTTDERGKHVPHYLNKLSDALTHEQNDLLENIQRITKSVDHLKEIINAQQSYAKVVALESSISLDELITDALKINQESLEHRAINVKKEIDVPPEVTLDKQKTLQILVNLIGNAAHALDGVTGDENWITIRCELQQNILRIEVADNGAGIPKENLTKIFNHGFTTKEDGHGFGLHSAALAAREMNGSLNVRSEGPGQGAAFTLEIPYKPAEQTHEQPHS